MTSAASSSDLPENMADNFLTETVVSTEKCLMVEAGGRSLESASSTASPLREISGGGPNMETLRSLSRLGMLHNYLTDRPNVSIEHH